MNDRMYHNHMDSYRVTLPQFRVFHIFDNLREDYTKVF